MLFRSAAVNEKAPEVIRGLFFSLPLLLLRLIQKRDVHKFQDEMFFSSGDRRLSAFKSNAR